MSPLPSRSFRKGPLYGGEAHQKVLIGGEESREEKWRGIPPRIDDVTELRTGEVWGDGDADADVDEKSKEQRRGEVGKLMRGLQLDKW